MPAYRFECDVCGERFRRDIPRALRDEPVTCPRCRTPFGKRELSSAERRKALRGDLLPRKFAGCG